MHTRISCQQQNNKMTYITTTNTFFRHVLLTVLHTNVMYKIASNVPLSLHITPLTHMIKSREGFTHSKLACTNMMVFFSSLVPVCEEAG